MSTSGKMFVCFCCLAPFARVKLDKKSRPFLACGACSTMVFPRGGAWATAAAAATLRLLEDPANVAWVRSYAADAASHGEASILELVRATAPALASVSVPVSQAEVSTEASRAVA